MSWRKISRPDALPHGTTAHRRAAADTIVNWYTGAQPRGDLGARLDFLTGQTSRSTTDMIRDIGTVNEVAAATGASARTVRDWRAGQHAPSPTHHAALARAARRATVTDLGGTTQVGHMTGRSGSSVRSWIRRPTRVRGDAVHRLNRHEVHQRHQSARQQAGQDPAAPLWMKATGHARVRTTTPTPPYDADRSVRHELDQTAQSRIEDGIARSEPDRAQQAIERTLTEDYATLGEGLYDGRDYGFFLDRIDELTFD